MPHPAIYIAELLLLSGFAVAGSFAFVLCLFFSVLLARVLCGNVGSACSVLFRLKWFFFAIFCISWLTSPGFPGDFAFSVRSLLLLLLLVLAVDCFHQLCDAGEKLLALSWWLSPLRRLGVPVERFVARLWLTIQLIPQQQQSLSGVLRSEDKVAGLRLLFDTAADEVALADGSVVKPGTVVTLPQREMRLVHWCRPVLLFVLLFLLRYHV